MPNVDLSDLSHSYPFLHLSRKLNIEYHHILRLVMLYDSGVLNCPKVIMEPYNSVWAVCHAPWRWDMSRAGDKGL